MSIVTLRIRPPGLTGLATPSTGVMTLTGAAATVSVGGNGPTISAVTGTVTQGGALTITGTQLINEDTSAYDSWFTESRRYFKGANAAADGYQTQDVSDIYVTTPKLIVKSGSNVVHTRISGTSEQSPGFAPYGDGLTGLPAAFYLRTYVRFHATGGWWGTGHKWIILYKGGDGFWCVYPSGDSGGWEDLWYLDNQNDWGPVNMPNGALVQDRWYCVIVRMKTTSTPVLSISFDGGAYQNGTPSGLAAGAPSGSGLQLGWNWSTGSAAGFVGDTYFDSLALSTSQLYPLSLVEIGDGATYASCNKVTQAMTSISDTSIAFTCNMTGLSGTDRYVYVTNNRQLVSAGTKIA